MLKRMRYVISCNMLHRNITVEGFDIGESSLVSMSLIEDVGYVSVSVIYYVIYDYFFIFNIDGFNDV